MNRLALWVAIAVLLAVRSAAAQALIPVEVQGAPFDLNGPLFYAQDLGYFKKAGLDVHISTAQVTVEGEAAAMLGGSINIGSANTATVAQAHLHGVDFRFLRRPGSSPTKRNRPRSFACRRTRRFTPRPTSTARRWRWPASRACCRSQRSRGPTSTAGTARACRFVEVPFPQMDAALAQHRVDAVVLTEPFATAAAGDTRVIGSAEDGVASSFMTLGWFATGAWLKANPDTALRFRRRDSRGRDLGQRAPQRIGEILSKYSKMSRGRGRCDGPLGVRDRISIRS